MLVLFSPDIVDTGALNEVSHIHLVLGCRLHEVMEEYENVWL